MVALIKTGWTSNNFRRNEQLVFSILKEFVQHDSKKGIIMKTTPLNLFDGLDEYRTRFMLVLVCQFTSDFQPLSRDFQALNN